MADPFRHCERSEAIQSQSLKVSLDCFAALAMTATCVPDSIAPNKPIDLSL
jgi:hypothetical protein